MKTQWLDSMKAGHTSGFSCFARSDLVDGVVENHTLENQYPSPLYNMEFQSISILPVQWINSTCFDSVWRRCWSLSDGK